MTHLVFFDIIKFKLLFQHKCEKYWVDREGEVKQYGMVRIRLIQGSDVCPDFSVRTIKLEYTNKDSTTGMSKTLPH